MSASGVTTTTQPVVLPPAPAGEEAFPIADPSFAMRKGILDQIQSAFHDHRLVVLAQPEEMYCKTGKTAVAKQFVAAHQNDYKRVFWVDDTALHQDGNLLDPLYQNENWLLVLDGIESERQLREAGFHLSTLMEKGKILVTSRERSWGNRAATILVGLFSKQEAVQFLCNQFPECSEALGNQIAQVLGYVPSSLEKIAQVVADCKLDRFFAMRRARLLENEKYLQKASNLPPRNQGFVGREPDLVALEESMSAEKPLVIAAEVGLGGIGKTQLALQYAYRMGPQYQKIWWVNAENESTLLSSYQEIARQLEIPVAEIPKYFAAHPGWLLIFDDAPDPDLIRKHAPSSGGNILITSRCTDWQEMANVFKMRPFRPEESVALMMQITGLNGQQQDAEELCSQYLHHLPLAVAQAASYIKETGISIREYIEKFKGKHEVLWKFERSPSDLYRHTVQVTWNLTMERIIEEEKIVLSLMQACSLFAPTDIPRDLILSRWIKFHLGTDWGKRELDRALALLSRYSMIDLTRESVSIHALVQTVIRDELTAVELERMVREMHKLFKNYQDDGKIPLFSFWDTKPDTINGLFMLLPHALSLASYAESLGMIDPAIELLQVIGFFSYMHGNISFGEAMIKRCLRIEERAGLYLNLGNLYLKTGELEKAEECYVKASSKDGFIKLLIKRGNLDRAEKMVREEIKRLRGGPKVLGGTTDSRAPLGHELSNLGSILIKKGNHQEAIKHLREAKTAFDEVDAKDSANSANLNMLLAQCYRALSDHQQEESHLGQAISIFEKTANKKQPDTIQPALIMCLEKLAHLATQKGESARASELLRHAIDYSEVKYGPQAEQTRALK